MTNIHMGSGGSNASPYNTWATAANSATTAWADAITASNAANGDDFYVDAAFTVSNASNQTLTFKGTAALPNRVFSCTTITHDAPLTGDLGAGATFTTTGTGTLTITGFVYIYGTIFNVGSGAVATNCLLGNGVSSEIVLDSCALNINVTGSSAVTINGTVDNKSMRVTLINTPIKLNGNTGTGIALQDCTFIWKNTASAIATGSQAAIANLFLAAARPVVVICDGVDFVGGVGIVSGKNLVAAQTTPSIFQFVNCKVASGVLIARPTVPGCIIDQIVTDSGATNYKQQRDTYQGTSTADTTVYNNASDGSSTPNLYSTKVVTTANANPQSPFECIGIPIWVAAGTYANSKVFLTSATASLKTNDVWAEIQYLGANYALGSTGTTFGAGSGSATLPQIPAGTTPGTLAAASPAWAHGSLGNDYQLAIPSFTTSADGYVWVVVKVGKASLTVNIDPAITIAA